MPYLSLAAFSAASSVVAAVCRPCLLRTWRHATDWVSAATVAARAGNRKQTRRSLRRSDSRQCRAHSDRESPAAKDRASRQLPALLPLSLLPYDLPPTRVEPSPASRADRARSPSRGTSLARASTWDAARRPQTWRRIPVNVCVDAKYNVVSAK